MLIFLLIISIFNNNNNLNLAEIVVLGRTRSIIAIFELKNYFFIVTNVRKDTQTLIIALLFQYHLKKISPYKNIHTQTLVRPSYTGISPIVKFKVVYVCKLLLRHTSICLSVVSITHINFLCVWSTKELLGYVLMVKNMSDGMMVWISFV